MPAVESAEEPNPLNDLRAKIMAISRDPNLTEEQKAKKRQEIMMGGSKWGAKVDSPAKKDDGKGTKAAPATAATVTLDDNLKCAICFELAERPVTAPCQHNFCLSCFNKWHAQGKKTCATCRAPFPPKFASNPRINTALAMAIRLAKNPPAVGGPPKEYKRIDNETRPDEAFTTERAVRAGRANAASGRIMVTIPNDHFGPISAEFDPVRNQGVRVGMWWKDRLDCRQWGAHFPHVAGIAGQSNVGAQSVVLSGGYEDDRDEGEWFLYTGSGGRDLSGNKRTNKVQSFDQVFESMNKALMLSCQRGLPVRVVRSYKEKRSAYAPPEEQPVRYDGVYRILRCWRKPGAQNFLICRYLFVRCDNEPAPWSSGESGDEPRMQVPKEAEAEIKQAKGKVVEMCSDPFWDYDPVTKEWGWAKPAPASQKTGGPGRGPADPTKRVKKALSQQQKLLKEFRCGLCHDALVEPLSTPCGHNFCRGCLQKKFAGIDDTQVVAARENMRVRRIQKPCPACKADICDFLRTAQVNREMAAIIEKLQVAVAKAQEDADKLARGEQVSVGEEEEGEDDAEEGGEEEVEGGEDEEEEAEEEAGTKKPATKRQRKESVPKAPAPAPEPKPAAAPPTAAPGPSSAPAPPPAAPADAPAAAAAADPADRPGGSRWPNEAAQLAELFPDFDTSLICGMLEDQGGDVEEVRACLKRMSRQAKAAASPKPKPARKQPTKRGGGRKRKQASDDEAEEEEEEAQQQAEAEAEAVDEEPTASPQREKKQGGRARKATVKAVAAAAAADDDEEEEEGDKEMKEQQQQRRRPPPAATADMEQGEHEASEEEDAHDDDDDFEEAPKKKPTAARGGKKAAAPAKRAKK